MSVNGGPGLTRWTGWDVRGGASADPAGAEQFARSAPGNPAAGSRFELLAVAARGFRPPKFLSQSPVTGAAGAEDDHPGLRLTWSLLYRQVAETAPAEVTPFAIYLLGVNPPVDATDDDLEVFNDFYTHVHLPEVAERRNALRAVRYELEEEIRAPYQGAPRFLAVYEVDEGSAANRRHQGPKYSSGPEVWQQHKTLWRLWFTRLGAGAPPDPA